MGCESKESGGLGVSLHKENCQNAIIIKGKWVGVGFPSETSCAKVIANEGIRVQQNSQIELIDSDSYQIEQFFLN